MLADSARVRVVRAAPGSGKTWLLAELLRRELARWTSRSAGVAALSFTNVASHEVRRALGREPGHPHFIGTFDSFLFRFIVRPFARVLYSKLAPPILIDAARADALADQQLWSRASLAVQVGSATSERAHLFRIVFREIENDLPTFAARIEPRGELRIASGNRAKEILRRKVQCWQGAGLVTHSDVAFLAATLLGDDSVAPRIQRVLAARFPILVVDELQDTGYFHGKALVELAKFSARRVIAVGDPDQAIYGFAGATGQFFDGLAALDGAVTLTVKQTRRCPAAVCRLAEQLSDSNSTIKAPAGPAGLTALVRCNSLDEARAFVLSLKNVSLLTRTNSLAEEFNGERQRALPGGISQAFRQLHGSVRFFQRGNMRAAFTSAESALARVVLDTEVVRRSQLDQEGIGYDVWRGEVAKLTKLAHSLAITSDSLASWCSELASHLKAQLKALGWPQKNIGQKLRRPPEKATRRPPLDASVTTAAGVEARTIHSVKGQTLDTVVLLVNPKQKGPTCPSVEWWPAAQGAANSEERRIAFVAVTRARSAVYLLAPDAVCKRLAETRPEFTSLLSPPS